MSLRGFGDSLFTQNIVCQKRLKCTLKALIVEFLVLKEVLRFAFAEGKD